MCPAFNRHQSNWKDFVFNYKIESLIEGPKKQFNSNMKIVYFLKFFEKFKFLI